ncbi:MAG TPA: endonuclease III [Patescibacteria group bacterium]|nr:endonuclease III [Patescibacteria group bacterium]
MVTPINDRNRIDKLLSFLAASYPKAKIVLHYKTSWELLVSVILSAQCTDVMVNKVTEKLFAKYRTLGDYVAAPISDFEKDIKSTGFYHNKAKNIVASARMVKEKFGGKVPRTMEEILTLPGVARKTANVVLGNAYGVIEGIAVDTHVHRLSQRLRLIDLTKIGGKKLMVFEYGGKPVVDYIKDADPTKIEKELMGVIPRDQWFTINHRLIDHGRAVCKAQNPDCDNCVLNKLCPSSRV